MTFRSRLTHWKARLESRAGLRKIAANMGWLLLDNFLRLGLGLFVGVWVARYLGPGAFGMLNYATALVAIATPFAALGIGNLLVRDMLKNPERIPVYLGTSLVMRLTASIFATIVLLVVVRGTRPDDWQAFWLVLVSSLGMIAQSFDGLEFYYQSKVMSKYVVWSKNAAVVLCAIFKVLAVTHSQPLLVFALIGLVELVVSTAIMLVIYVRQGNSLSAWSWSWERGQALLKESWPLIIGLAGALLNMRIGQVIIGDYIDNEALGNYSAAVRISEIWLMIPGVLGASIFPAIVKLKERDEAAYRRSVIRIFISMFAIAMVFSFTVSALSPWIVNLLYGSQYQDAAKILSVHIWSGVPYFSTFVFAQVFYVEGLTKMFFYSSLIAPIITIGSTLVFVKSHGAVGVAGAALLTNVFNAVYSAAVMQYKVSFFTRKS